MYSYTNLSKDPSKKTQPGREAQHHQRQHQQYPPGDAGWKPKQGQKTQAK